MYIPKKEKKLETEILKISKKKLDNFMREAEIIAHQAGKYSLKFFGKPSKITKKGPRDIVTEIDFKCQEMIKEHLLKKFPEHGFCGEEGDNENIKDKDFVWIVDPIDGTTNFAHGYPCYCVSIGLIYKNVPILGVVYAPLVSETYKAHIGTKAYKNGKILHVSNVKKVIDSLIILGFYYNANLTIDTRLAEFKRILMNSQSIRRDGSAALNVCRVAEGVSDAFFEVSLNAWDIAAGLVIAYQAGATITESDAKSYYDIFSRKGLVVSNGLIHKELCKYILG